MTLTTTAPPASLRGQSFSFYVPAKAELIVAGDSMADLVVVRGRKGPGVVRQLRSTGWTGAVLFDGCAYERPTESADPEAWFAHQREAGADRLLTPGRWVPWDTDPAVLRSAVQAENDLASAADNTTVLVAMDVRWLKPRQLNASLATLGQLDHPIALVLAHPKDPLGPPGVVPGLMALTRQIPKLTILRCDHGAVGALAYGAVHGSIGLTPTYRHFVPPQTTGGGIPNDTTPRVFVWPLMDWFTVSTIAGWATSKIPLTCPFGCCQGQQLDRFLDPRRDPEADHHNRTLLALLANHVLNAPVNDRRRIFAALCHDAVGRYGTMGGLTTLIEPKSQLQQWAQAVGI